MGHVATRLLALANLMQSREIWKASELSERLDVSVRTIHRYMEMLEEMGVPIYSQRGRYGGFSLLRGQRLPPMLFTAEEATVLYMGAHLVRGLWGQTYEHAVSSAVTKLDNVLADEQREAAWHARQHLSVGALTRRHVGEWEGTLDVLRQCLHDRRCVHLLYRGAGQQEAAERVVEPYALSFQWSLWYLVGFCRLCQALRTFRVDRVVEATPLNECCVIPPGFSIREYVANMRWPEPEYEVVVRLAPQAGKMLREEHPEWLSLTQEEDDGPAIARFGANDLNWAVGWVLSFGPLARVLAPEEMIERVRRAASATARVYDEEPSRPED